MLSIFIVTTNPIKAAEIEEKINGYIFIICSFVLNPVMFDAT